MIWAADWGTVCEWVSSSGPLRHISQGRGRGTARKNAYKFTFKPFNIICADRPRILRTEEYFFLENALNCYLYLTYLFSSVSIFLQEMRLEGSDGCGFDSTDSG